MDKSLISVPTMRAILTLTLCLLLAVPAIAEPFRVVDVADGDIITIEPKHGGARSKVRLHGIDTPEMGQPFGQAAKAFVVKAALFKDVDVQPTPQGKDQYGRIVAVIVLPDGTVLQEMLLQAGLAWVYPQYCKNCRVWEAMQAEAKTQGKGLWITEKPVPPWEWRKATKKR